MIDGVEYAGETMVVAVGITADGTKRILGLRQERPRTLWSARRCWRICEAGAWTQLVLRCWCSTAPRLCTRRRGGVWGAERCDPALPGPQDVATSRDTFPRSTTPSWSNGSRRRTTRRRTRPRGRRWKATVRWLERINPDAASSLREGLEETLTVVRLGLPEALRRTLATTNPIESALA